jgi:hypothetical protein
MPALSTGEGLCRCQQSRHQRAHTSSPEQVAASLRQKDTGSTIGLDHAEQQPCPSRADHAEVATTAHSGAAGSTKGMHTACVCPVSTAEGFSMRARQSRLGSTHRALVEPRPRQPAPPNGQHSPCTPAVSSVDAEGIQWEIRRRLGPSTHLRSFAVRPSPCMMRATTAGLAACH